MKKLNLLTYFKLLKQGKKNLLLIELNDKIAVTNKKTGQTYEITKPYYDQHKSDYDIPKDKGIKPISKVKPSKEVKKNEPVNLGSLGSTQKSSINPLKKKGFATGDDAFEGFIKVNKKAGLAYRPNPKAQAELKKQFEIMNAYKPLTANAIKGLHVQGIQGNHQAQQYFRSDQEKYGGNPNVPKEVDKAATKALKLMQKLSSTPMELEMQKLYRDSQKRYDKIQDRAYNNQISMDQMRRLLDINHEQFEKKEQQIKDKYKKN